MLFRVLDGVKLENSILFLLQHSFISSNLFCLFIKPLSATITKKRDFKNCFEFYGYKKKVTSQDQRNVTKMSNIYLTQYTHAQAYTHTQAQRHRSVCSDSVVWGHQSLYFVILI